MISKPPSSRKEAILIMDSRNMPGAAVRHHNFQCAWSQLYKAGDLYLDLSLKVDEKGTILVGQVIAEAQNPVALHVTLHGPSQSSSSPVNEYGNFRVSIVEKGDHLLEFELGEESFVVRRLEML